MVFLALMVGAAVTSQGSAATEASNGGRNQSTPSVERFVCSSDRFNITTVRQVAAAKLTRSDKDFKPISSLDGKILVFFRVLTYGDGTFESWRTAICVINTDGTGFRQITDGKHSDYNPTFMRDGSNRIAFNRYNDTGKHECKIFLTTVSSKAGEEQQVSHPTISSYEWVYSSLKDGRLFVHRIESAAREVYLLTPNPGGLGKYERVQMPSNQYFHKACISPSESRITYMYDQDNNGATYADARIAWAKFDVKSRRVFDQVLITEVSPKTIEEYPKWSPDESEVLYDSNKARGGGDIHQIYAYDLAAGKERNLSPDASHNYQFVCLLGLPH
jgi:Tol biopolymer transport system component